MKIKLILVPSIVVLIIVLGIWFVYPAYSNGTNGLMDNYSKLKAERQKLESIKGKSGNANELAAQLDSMGTEKDILYEFIPAKIKESEIVNNLNKMAADSGLLIYGLSVGRPSLEVASIAAPQTLGSTSIDATISVNKAVSVLPKAKNFEASMQISGSYDQVKTFMDKLSNFARYNKITSFYVKKGDAASGGSNDTNVNASTDLLIVDLKAEFNLLNEAKISNSNVSDSVFSSSNMDTKIVSEIKSARTGLAVGVDTGQKGKSNPFMP